MQECRYARYRPARDVPVKTDPNKIRSDDERTAGSLVPIRILIPRATHILSSSACSSAAIAMQCNRSYQAQLLFHKCSQLKSSTLGRVPPYILFKHTRESNRSPALRSDLGSHRPSHSFASLNRFGPATLSQESWSFTTRLGLASSEESCPTQPAS